MADKVVAARCRVARASRISATDDRELTEARRDYKAAQLEQFIEKALATAPPLSDDQRTHLAALIAGGER